MKKPPGQGGAFDRTESTVRVGRFGRTPDPSGSNGGGSARVVEIFFWQIVMAAKIAATPFGPPLRHEPTGLTPWHCRRPLPV